MREILRRYRYSFVASVVALVGAISNWDSLPSRGIIVSIVLLFLGVFMLEIELDQMKSGHPNLIYKDYWIERKIIDMKLPTVGNDGLYHSFSNYDETTYPTTDTSFQEDEESNDVFDNYVVGVWIANDPKNRNKYSISEDTVVRITFFTPNRDIEIEGRWWIRDTPLYPPKGTDFEKLRKTNIEPGDPKRLVIAYKVRGGNLFYPFGYHTFNEMAKQRQEVNLGKGNIKFQIVLESVNLKPTPPQFFLLDGSYDNITIKRI